MKAIILVQPGSTSNLVLRDINTPQIGDEEVVVQVKSISVNPVDAKTRKGGRVYNYGNVSKQSDLILGWAERSGPLDHVLTELKMNYKSKS